jgi:hypothetical protein
MSSGSRVFPCGQTDRRTDMTKLIVAFRNFANAPKNSGLNQKYLRHVQNVNNLRVHSKQTALPNTEQNCLYNPLRLSI